MSPLTSRQQWSAGALALLFHAVFFLALVFSVSWRQAPSLPVMAELWTSLPAPPVQAEPRPLPPPPPKPAEVNPEPSPAKPEPSKADIALKAKEAAKQREAELQRIEQEKKRLKLEQEKKLEAERRQKEEAARKKAMEERKRALDRTLAEQMDSELAQEAAQLNQMRQQQQASAARNKLIADYQERIRQKIRSYIRLPRNLTGNPEAVFRVELLPNGEVQRAVLVRTSGQTAYDQEVERAILKASPLPMPPDPAAAASFRSGLTLKFRPQEG
ncbi:cell division and transport-associated protein TolA [Sulfuritortus calidifontis]|uniref:Cell division and transport-associated protein TolA n=1 Tax=Sulfuritortus calidifontis TaxID=1914471 RepID=A0A4R3JZA9_9PROT|nr:energy transducer TonB [Sulfuritortus calidifontis]TCS74064.1 cell division and transport-associated protein TolA [Sulfuritortus calidifontis]